MTRNRFVEVIFMAAKNTSRIPHVSSYVKIEDVCVDSAARLNFLLHIRSGLRSEGVDINDSELETAFLLSTADKLASVSAAATDLYKQHRFYATQK